MEQKPLNPFERILKASVKDNPTPKPKKKPKTTKKPQKNQK